MTDLKTHNVLEAYPNGHIRQRAQSHSRASPKQGMTGLKNYLLFGGLPLVERSVSPPSHESDRVGGVMECVHVLGWFFWDHSIFGHHQMTMAAALCNHSPSLPLPSLILSSQHYI